MPPNPTPGFSESAIAIRFRLTLRFFARMRSACGLRAIFIGLLAGATGQAPGGPIHGTVLFPQETVLTSTQANLASVATADFDGDGYADVVASSNNPDMIVWYRNNGDGTFGSQPYVIATFPTTAVGNVAVGDLDGDGRIDVAYWSGDQRVKWSRNVGGALSTGLFGYNPGDLAANQNLVSGTEDVDTTVSIGDVNGDGLPDILSATIFSSLVTPANNNIVAWYRNLGGGNFGWNAATPTGNRNVLPTQGRISPSSVRAGDLNGDGRPDVVVTFRNSGRMGWIRGGGSVASPIFTYVELTTNGQVGGPAASVPTAQSSATTDLDGDGWPDLVCAATGLPTLVWFRNTSHDAVPTATFFGGPQTISGSLIGAYSVVSADLNSDGKTDLVAVAAGGNRVYRWENLGGGSLTQSVVSTAVNFPVSVAAADFNLDGVPDAVSASNGNSTVAAYLNRGGQCALVTADTAPATITEGRKDDVLRIAVSNRGVAGDNSARVFSLTLLFERSAGIPLTTAEANALIDTFYVYLDSNNSGAFDLGTDTLVGTVPNLVLTAGQLVFPLAPSNQADTEVAPGATRNYFAVAKITGNAFSQSPNFFRVTHLSHGTGHSTLKDATLGAVLTIESDPISNAPSSIVSAQQMHTYTDWSFLWFDGTGAAGTGPSQSQFGDGVPNVLKYALSIDPLANNAPLGLPRIFSQAGAKVFRHIKPSWATDLTYRYEISRTLGSWSPAILNVDYTQTNTPLANGIIQSDLTILGPWTKSFMRVAVDLAP